MRKFLTTIAGATLLALLATGCSVDSPQVVEVDLQPQGAEIFGNYVAVGNSLTAGYMDAGVIMNGQATSYPQLIANSFGYPAGSFVQPMIAAPGVGTTDLGEGYEGLVAGVLHYNMALGGIFPLGTTPLAEVPTLLLAATWPVPYSNLGVPGATTLDMTDALDSSTSQAPGNSYFDIVLRNPTFGNKSMLEQLVARGPTIATMWIGNNDILGGATSGTPIVGVTLTPSAAFGAMYTALLDGVLDGVEDRHGYRPMLFVANIPSITSIPYFMPPAVFNGLVAAVTEGAITEVPTVEEDVAYFRFPALGHIGSEGIAALPLDGEWTLTADEVAVVENLVDEYNTIIDDAVAARPEVFLYDANEDLQTLTMFEGMHFLALLGSMSPADAANTTLFSLDGVHPNNRGYARVANGFLEVMNGVFGTEFPMVDLGAVAWDPSYGTGLGGEETAAFPTLTPEAAAAVDAILQ